MSCIVLPTKINHACAASVARDLCKKALTQKQDTDTSLWVDASALQEFDSSALAVLLALRRVAAQHDKDWQVQAASPHLKELAGLYGVDELLWG